LPVLAVNPLATRRAACACTAVIIELISIAISLSPRNQSFAESVPDLLAFLPRMSSRRQTD
jgi:hypothetical protein